MDSYRIVYSSDSLEHHGILGQKWGVRRYQNADGSLTTLGAKRYRSLEKSQEKYENAKTRIGKTYHNYNSSEKKYEIERANNVKKANSLSDKFSEAYGFGNLATRAGARSEKYANKADIALTKRGKIKNEARAYNNEQLQKYAKDMQSKSAGERFIESAIIRSNLMGVSVKSVAGRESTYGKEVVLGAFTLGIGNKVLDMSYKREQKKSENNNSEKTVKKEFSFTPISTATDGKTTAFSKSNNWTESPNSKKKGYNI